MITRALSGYFILLTILFSAESCRKEHSQPAEEVVNVGFRLNLPSASQQPVRTYAITANDENVIYNIVLLAFKVSGGTETLAYYKEGMQIYSEATANEKSFYTRLLKSSDHFRFVLLINGGQELSNLIAGIPLNTEKSDVMEQLTYSITQKWDTDPATFSPIPMWGESTEVAGIDAQTVLPGVQLYRSLARVDVTLSGTALSDFTIESVHIYGANDKLLMAPLPVNVDFDSKPIAPSIPSGVSPLLPQQYLFSAASSVTRDIYIPEAGAGDTWVVIGGKMASDPTNTYYYRANFEDAGHNLIPVVRNTRYVINVTKVNGAGAVDPDLLTSFATGADDQLKTTTLAEYEQP